MREVWLLRCGYGPQIASKAPAAKERALACVSSHVLRHDLELPL